MQQEDIIKDIRTRCRMGMNGITSTSMRQKGLSYKVNFGLAIQQIKNLAERYQPDKQLAETLWKEDTRELKILATLLYPVAEFTEETANRWVTTIPNQEIREQVCMNLFQNLPFAEKVAVEWGYNADEDIRTTGYWLVARLFLIKKIKHIAPDAFSYIWDDVVANNISLRNAALQALKHIGRQSEDTAGRILEKLSVHKESSDLVKQEAYNGLVFEFEYYFGE